MPVRFVCADKPLAQVRGVFCLPCPVCDSDRVVPPPEYRDYLRGETYGNRFTASEPLPEYGYDEQRWWL